MMMSFKAVVTLQSYSAVMEGGRPLCSPGDQSLNGQHWGGGAVTWSEALLFCQGQFLQRN